MRFLIENWYIILAFAAVLAVGIYTVYVFVKRPRNEQINAVREWLLYAVIEAEKQFGSKTGELKLRYVYNMFIERFGFLADVITFEMVKGLVDEALERMEQMLTDNEAVVNYVGHPAKKEAK